MLSTQQANFHFDIPEIRDISQCFMDTFLASGIDLASTAVASILFLIGLSMFREVLHRTIQYYYHRKVSCVVLNTHRFWRIPMQLCILLHTSCTFSLHTSCTFSLHTSCAFSLLTSCASLIHNTFCHLFREKSYLRTPAFHFRAGRS